jgi:hypothetical protein
MRNHVHSICGGLVLIASASFASAAPGAPGAPGTPDPLGTNGIPGSRSAEPACPFDADPGIVIPGTRSLGAAMAIEDGVAAVNAYRGADYPDQSSIFILNKVDDQWLQTDELSLLSFNTSSPGVDLDDGRFALGWSGEPLGGLSNAGVVYIYEQDEGVWTMTHELRLSSFTNTRSLGLHVLLAGDLLFSTAFSRVDGEDPGDEPKAGAVVVFRYDGSQWVQEQTLISPHHYRWNSFGYDMAYAGGQLFIHGECDTSGAERGRVYIYEHLEGSWTLVQTLEGSEPTGQDWFGLSLEVRGDVAVIPAPLDEQTAGKVYIFERIGGQWMETQIIENPEPLWSPGNPNSSDFFGRGLAFDGDTIVIGAPQYWNESNETHPGRAWIYRHDGAQWSLVAGIAPPFGQANDHMGFACELDGEDLLISAVRTDTTTENAGVVYSYRIDDCDGNSAIDAIEICEDPGLDTNGDWILDVCLTPCPWDVAPAPGSGDGLVGLGDLNALLSNWGACPAPCAYDFAPAGGDGLVGLGDLNALLSNWGPCP